MRPAYGCVVLHDAWSSTAAGDEVIHHWICPSLINNNCVYMKWNMSCVFSEAAAVCSNSSPVKVKHSESELLCIYWAASQQYECNRSIRLYLELWSHKFGHVTVLQLNGSEIDIDLLVCSRVDITHSIRKQKIQHKVSKGEASFVCLLFFGFLTMQRKKSFCGVESHHSKRLKTDTQLFLTHRNL